MRKITVIAAALSFVFLCACSSNNKQEPTLKEGAKEVGTAVGTAAREVGHGFKKVGKEIGEAAKEGGHAFRDAVHGDNKGDNK
jgi:hypothetical protein